MSDHWHYASEIHGAAEQHHRHYDIENSISEEAASRRVCDQELWDSVNGLSDQLVKGLDRITALEGLTSVYGETLDDLRNRVYALEHGQPPPQRHGEDDDSDYAGDGEGITGLHWDNLGSGGAS